MSEASKRNQTAPSESPAVSAPPAVEPPAKKSPREWAQLTGNGPKKGARHRWTAHATPGMSRQMGSMAHEVASVLHGWKEHEHHENAPILLTKEQYLAALEAAMPKDVEEVREVDGKDVKVVKLGGNAEPHKAALSEHRGGRVRREFRNGAVVKIDPPKAEVSS